MLLLEKTCLHDIDGVLMKIILLDDIYVICCDEYVVSMDIGDISSRVFILLLMFSFLDES